MKKFIHSFKRTGVVSTIFICSAVLMLSTIFYSCKSQSKTESPKQTIKIGAIIPLTGDSAFWGGNIKNGIDLATEEINEKGGILGKRIEIVYEDTQAQPSVGTRVVSKLITVDHVQCIIGDTISSVMLAVAPIMQRNKCVLLGFGESAEITNAGDYIFRNWNSAVSDAEITAEYARKHSRNVIVLAQNDAFGKSAKELFTFQLRKYNVNILMEETFSKGETDFRTLLTKIKRLEYDGIYLASFHQDALVFFRQYKELGLRNVTFYGVSSWEEGSFISFLKKNFPGKVVFGYPKPPDPDNPVIKQFRMNYLRKYRKEPEILCDNGYDAVYMLKNAIEKSGRYDGEAIKDALYTLSNFEGASGTMSFDKNGDVHKPFGLKIVEANGLRWLE